MQTKLSAENRRNSHLVRQTTEAIAIMAMCSMGQVEAKYSLHHCKEHIQYYNICDDNLAFCYNV